MREKVLQCSFLPSERGIHVNGIYDDYGGTLASYRFRFGEICVHKEKGVLSPPAVIRDERWSSWKERVRESLGVDVEDKLKPIWAKD